MRWEFAADDLPTHEIRNAFRINGFVLIRGVLDRYVLSEVRAELDRAFESEALQGLSKLCFSELLRRETIWRCLFKDSVVKALRAALGPELCYQSDLDVQRNSYGQGGLSNRWGWHMDAGSETGRAYLLAADYRFAKCGIFLQDFDNDWGGGIMIKRKSHRRFFEDHPIKRTLFFLRRACDRAAIRLGVEFDTMPVPTRAGDLCFFDSRLLHSSVLPSAANIRKIGYHRKGHVGTFWAEVPKAHTKYVIYWDACNVAMAPDFLRNSILRSENELSGMQEQPGRLAAFTRILSLRYPDDYPAAFVAAAASRDVAVASLDAGDAAVFKRKLSSMRLLQA